jgi:hypothetical protein
MAFDLAFGQTKRNWGRSSMGSFIFPVKEQRSLMAKLDDLRYDIRGMKSTIGGALFALSGALGALAIASVYRTAKKDGR